MEQDKIRIVIIDDIAETRENLRKLLSFSPDIEVVGAGSSGEEGVQLAIELKPHVMLMDINLPGIDGITATGQIVEEVPTVQIIILSVQGDTGYMRRAMAAGARDFLVKPPSGDELLSTIRRVYEIGKAQAARIVMPGEGGTRGGGARGSAARGNLVTVYAPKGGVGCTSVAVNLGLALQNRLGSDHKVAMVDGNLQFGDVGVMLNLQATRSIVDLVGRLSELDLDLLNNVVTPHPSGLKAMLAPPSPEAAEPMLAGSADGGEPVIRGVLSAMLQEFNFVVADTWGWVDETTLTLLDEAALVLLVITPLVPDIRATRNFLDLATKLGYSHEKLALVINQSDRRTGIRIEQIEKALIPTIGQIPFDERAGTLAANRGMPVVIEEAGKPIALAYDQLAGAVVARVQELLGGMEAGEMVSAEESRNMLGRILT